MSGVVRIEDWLGVEDADVIQLEYARAHQMVQQQPPLPQWTKAATWLLVPIGFAIAVFLDTAAAIHHHWTHRRDG